PRAECGGGGGGPARGAGQQRGREPQQPAARLLLPQAAVGSGLPVAPAVLSQPPPLPAQRARRAGGQESGGTPHGPGAPALAGEARLPTLPAGLTRTAPAATGNRPKGGRARGPECYPKKTIVEPCPNSPSARYASSWGT